MKIAVSYLKSKNTQEETIKKIEQTSADFIHVDLMDGIFVEKNNIYLKLLEKLLKNTSKKLDLHLMTQDVEPYLEELKKLNPEYITFHIESSCNVEKTIKQIKTSNIKVGIALKPNSQIDLLKPYLTELDQILIMSVEPGRGGQSFMPQIIPKLEEIRSLQKRYHFQINIDGGINEETIKQVKDHVDIIVSGSFICEAENYEKQIEKLRK